MQLRDYQITLAGQACSLLRSFHIAYLCLEVRVGKTLTALEAARLYGAKKVLFVTKLKAISSIQKDYEATGKEFSLYVINYESLNKCESGWDLVIIDEAHGLGQYPSPATRVNELRRICAGLPIIYLSGTPSPESYAQFFHQFYVSSFGPWEGINFYKWHKQYGVPKVKYMYNRQIADYSVVKPELITPIINQYMLKFTQEEAGFSSLVEEEIIRVPMSENVKWAVAKLKKDKIIRTKDGQVILGDTAVKEMQKIHQLCSGTFKSEEGEYVVYDYTKARAIKERFEGKKVAIFYKYVAERAQLMAMFNPHVIEDSGDFNRAQAPAIYLSQYQSGREGVNLSGADCIVMYNPDFSAVSYWQARARLQVKERKTPATVYWVFTDGGIEEKIYEVVKGKKDFTLSHYRKIK